MTVIARIISGADGETTIVGEFKTAGDAIACMIYEGGISADEAETLWSEWDGEYASADAPEPVEIETDSTRVIYDGQPMSVDAFMVRARGEFGAVMDAHHAAFRDCMPVWRTGAPWQAFADILNAMVRR